MTEDEILELGGAAAILLLSPYFDRLSNLFSQDVVATMLSTGPLETELREKMYAKLNGARDFIAFLADFAKQAKQIEEAHTPRVDHDDPRVHDIYKE